MKPIENLDTFAVLAAYWAENMPSKPPGPGEMSWREWDGLNALLKEFGLFSGQYKGLLESAPLQIQKYAINKGVESLTQGFSLISRACEQRRGKITLASFQKYLALAEDVLDGYCRRWLKSARIASPYLRLRTPVVYFEKIFGINRSLYAPQIPLISIPLFLYNRPEQWLALAHEMGHHLYWNSLDSYEETVRFQSDLISAVGEAAAEQAGDIWASWTEELFADVCGTLFAGPSYAISCQDTAIVQARQLRDLAENDDEHPAPYLRPLIAIQVLRELYGEGQAPLIQKIDDRWTKYSAGAENEMCWYTHPHNEEPPRLTLKELAADVPAVVQKILYEKIWSGEKNLLALIEPPKVSPIEIDDLGDLNLANEVNPIFIKDNYKEIAGPNDRLIPKSILDDWKQFKMRFERTLPPTERALGETLGIVLPGIVVMEEESSGLLAWMKLLDLDLNDDHGHASNNHGNCKRHVNYLRRHKHDDVGGIVNC